MGCQAATRKPSASQSKIAYAARACATWPRWTAHVNAKPSLAGCPVRIEGSPHIGRSRSNVGMCDRAIGVVSGPLARCRSHCVWTALGAASRITST